MKKALSIILSAALMLVCLSAFAVSYASGYVYTTDGANVRTGPGTGYASIGSVKENSSLPYLNASSTDYRGVTWYKVSFSNSYGWISSAYCYLSDDYSAPRYSAGGSGNYSGGSDSVYTTGNVNIRTGPGLGYTSIGTADKGTYLPYLGSSSLDGRGVTWFKVSYQGTSGWVSSTYATMNGYPSSSQGDSGDSVYITGNVNVRTGPGLSYASIGTSKKGSTLPYLGDESIDGRGVAWFMVSYKGQVGWVSSTYANLAGTGGSYTPNYNSTVRATGGDSHVRTGPGLGYSSYDTLYQGQSAPYLGSTSVDGRGVAWYQISFGGRAGWVSSRYTSLY